MRFVVHGASMEPTYHEGDRLFVSRFLYLISSPRLHDIVIIRDPRDGRLLLKRITVIKDGKYFVAGDNPKASTDSRIFGAISKERIIGRVMLRYRKAK